MKRSVLTAMVALGVGAVGCASPGTPSAAPPTPTAEEPTPTPTPTPTEQSEPEAERIIVGAEEILVLAADGSELAAYDYFQNTSELIAGFTELFGAPPVDTAFDGDTHAPPGIERNWDGFAILDDEREPTPPHTPNHLVDVTTTEVNGITVETADGFAVGTPAAEALAAPDAEPVNSETGQVVQVDAVPLDFDDPICPESGCTLSVRLFTDESGETLARILAPTPNFGP
ncbi:hypothetical protein ACFFGH_25535 [Lysobacter korlensis]|uniref:Uncharacterized protein n=1 Tax=Lysobacter korlensis TaxID=553636 RepID=A0ABV6RW49_9GAMM